MDHLAALLTASATALVFKLSGWNEFWGNPVVPSLLLSTAAGMVVSLLLPPDERSPEEALEMLKLEREEMQAD